MFCVLLNCTNIEYNEQAIAMHVLLLIWSHSFFPFSFYYYFSHRFIVSLKSSFSFLSFIRFHLLSYYFISRFNFSYSSANIHFVKYVQLEWTFFARTVLVSGKNILSGIITSTQTHVHHTLLYFILFFFLFLSTTWIFVCRL